MVNMQVDTEQSILITAQKHFMERGFRATRMQEIADEVGINKAMLHYYFRSKDKLYRKVVGYTLGELVPKIAAVMGSQLPFWEKIELIVSTYIDLLTSRPNLPAFVMNELASKNEAFTNELKQHAAQFSSIQVFILQIHQEMEAGRIKNYNPMQLMLNVMGLTIFPFMAKPIFTTIFSVGDPHFESMMQERKVLIVEFLKSALIANK